VSEEEDELEDTDSEAVLNKVIQDFLDEEFVYVGNEIMQNNLFKTQNDAVLDNFGVPLPSQGK